MILGEGRAGKSSLLRALTGKPFVADLASTTGVSVTDCISDTKDAGASIGEYVKWCESDKDKLEIERTLLEQVASEARKPKKLASKKENAKSRIVQSKNHEQKSRQEPQQEQKKPAEQERKAPTESKIVVSPRSKQIKLPVEKDEVKHKGDYRFSASSITSDEPSITFTIFDYGGQRCFQCLQHVLLSCTGIYVVCFDMVKLSSPDEAEKTNALGFIRFWLQQIALQASGAPVLLVGTHKDVISDDATHASISAYLDNNLSHVTCLKRNDALCFFPIDNQQALGPDRTLDVLRKRIEREVEVDSLNYVNQEMPTSWLAFCDELRITSRHEGVKYLKRQNSSPEAARGGGGGRGGEGRRGGGDKVRITVIDLARKHGIFQGSLSEDEQLSSLLTTLHALGVIIFYDDPLLRDTIILDPQWLIDSLVAIIRDFRLHRFESDRVIMEHEPLKWSQLKKYGLLSSSLLPYLWLGSDDETKRFLVSMMERLMLLTPIGTSLSSYDPASTFETLFLVPSIVSAVDEAAVGTQAAASSPDLASTELSSSCLSISFRPFSPEALFPQFITFIARSSTAPSFPSTSSAVLPFQGESQLVPPCIFYSTPTQVAACLVLSGITLLFRPSLVDPSAVVEVLVLSVVPLGFDLQSLNKQIQAAVDTINKDFYQGSLRVDFSSFSVIKDLSAFHHVSSSTSSTPLFQSSSTSSSAPSYFDTAAQIEASRFADGTEILSHFMTQKCEVEELDAKRYASALVERGYKGAGCFDLLKNKAHDNAFDVEALIGLADIDNRAFADQIFRELKRAPDVKDPIVLALYDKSFGSETEVDKIPRAIGYKGKCKKMAVSSSSLLTNLSRELPQAAYTVLHLASRTRATAESIGVPLFLSKADEDPLTLEAPVADELVEEISSCASLECIVLNYATSSAINGLAARLEAKGLSNLLFIIGWQGNVDSNAMSAFTEYFYAELRSQKDGSRDYRRAYEKARNFLLRCNMNCNFETDDLITLFRLRAGPPVEPRAMTVGVLMSLDCSFPSNDSGGGGGGGGVGGESSVSSVGGKSPGAPIGAFAGGSGGSVATCNLAAFCSHAWGDRKLGWPAHQKIKRIYERLVALDDAIGGLPSPNYWLDESSSGSMRVAKTKRHGKVLWA